jgi:hypothetical protein
VSCTLYGQPLSRIAAMTTSQVTRHDDQTLIQLGRHDVAVPGPLADAALQLIKDGLSYRGVGSPPTTTWLFPGHLPGRPITPGTLGQRLRTLGIYAQTGRRAALLDLAAQLPAAVLADLLGLHHNTAARWMHQAGGDWTRYAAVDPPAILTNPDKDLADPGPQPQVFNMVRNLLPTSLVAGVSVRTVRGRLGHANAATTLGVDAHFVEQSDRDAAE